MPVASADLDLRARGTRAAYEALGRDRHLIHGALAYWAARKPDGVAVVNATRGTELTWGRFQAASTALAALLLRKGLKKGDFLATSLPLSDAHILLEYACFRIGAIHVPLDLRLSEAERDRCLRLVNARVYITSQKIEPPPGVENVWDGDTLDAFLETPLEDGNSVLWPEVHPDDGAQVVFTTGSTGQPKAALLTHRSITAQNFALGLAFNFEGARTLVNLPPSHVGGQSELLMTTLFWGATAVTLEVFDAGKSLEAIERHRVTLLGQIPAMFQMEWRHPDYGIRDLSSLELVVYGGQSVPRPFLEKLRTMAPMIATGLGLTEASGFCTYTPLTEDAEALSVSLGTDLPLYAMTIRNPMSQDGLAGAELPEGETGCVCFQGPQTFGGYVGDPEATAQALSRDGVLYTGDMGFRDGDGLHFAGRERWLIKPAGYKVFPGDVETHFCALENAAACSAVGVDHPLWMEAVVAFVEKVPGSDLTATELRRHARKLTTYMRPLHYIIVEPGQLPLNRVGKVDMVQLKAMADQEVEGLKRRGRWGSRVAQD